MYTYSSTLALSYLNKQLKNHFYTYPITAVQVFSILILPVINIFFFIFLFVSPSYVVFHYTDIHEAAEAIAGINKVDLISVQNGLIQKWLQSSNQNQADSDTVSTRFSRYFGRLNSLPDFLKFEKTPFWYLVGVFKHPF